MRLYLRFRDFDTTFEREATSLILGRPRTGSMPPDVDLSPDRTVSRPHARLFLQDNDWYLEDLGSTHGTQLSGRDIGGVGPQLLKAGDSFQCGETTIRPEIGLVEALAALSEAEIAVSLPAVGDAGFGALPDEGSRQLGQIYDLLLRCGDTDNLDELLREIVGRVVDVMPNARRGALLLHSRETDTLLLAGFRGVGGPAVSETLARQAMF